MPSLFALIPTYRRPRELADSLARVVKQSRPPDEIVVVDNDASGEGARGAVERFPDEWPVTYVESPENLGFAGGVALGMETILPGAAPDDWIVVLDDDDPLPSDTLFSDLERFAHEMIRKDPRTACVGLVGAKFDWKRGGLIRVPDRDLRGPVPVDFIGGNHFPIYSVRAIRDVGTFSREIFFGLSEVEHGLRLRRAGYSVYAHGDLWLDRRAQEERLGLDMRPSTRIAELNWRRYYSLRNSIYILRSHGRWTSAVRVTAIKGLAKPLANLFTSPTGAAQHLKMNARACYDGWTGRMGRRLDPDGSSRPTGDPIRGVAE